MFPEVMLIVEYERVSEFQNVWKYGSHQRNWEECEDVTPTTPPLQTKIIIMYQASTMWLALFSNTHTHTNYPF